MSGTEVYAPDAEGVLRDYLRQDIACQSVFGQRIFFGFNDAIYPAAVVMRVGGGMDLSEANIDQALMQVDVWGEVRNKSTCWAATATVLGALRSLGEGWASPGKGKIYSPGASSWAWLPDPSSERSRYSITVPLTVLPDDTYARVVALTGSHLIDSGGDDIVV